MLKWLLKIAEIAATTNVRIPFILFLVELLKQFDRSIVNSESQPLAKHGGKAGFIYMIRDSADGERFKIGHRAKLPSEDRQLLSEIDGTKDFVLIIPAKNVRALEKRLRRAYAKHSKKGEWFSLKEWERREIMIIAAVIGLLVGDDLGVSAVDLDIVPIAADLLKELQKRVNQYGNKKGDERKKSDYADEESDSEPDSDDDSTIPVLDWNWESVLDEDYRALTELKGKRGYVSIIRDTGTDRYKTFFEKHPVDAIDAAFSETDLRFQLEVVLILKVDNMKKAKEALLSPTERKHGTDWIDFPKEQLGELRRPVEEDRVHGSIYLTPKKRWGLETLPINIYEELPTLEKLAGYVCVVQGVKPGNKYKIWHTRHPQKLGGDFRLALLLNNPHDAKRSRNPIKFSCINKADHSKSFQTFLKERYAAHRARGDWFELDDAQLQEINSLGK